MTPSERMKRVNAGLGIAFLVLLIMAIAVGISNAQCQTFGGRVICAPPVRVATKVRANRVVVQKAAPTVIRKAAVIAETPVVNQVLFSVGQDLRTSSLIRTIVREELRAALAEVGAASLSQGSAQGQVQSSQPNQRQAVARSLSKEVCGQCHSGDTPKADLRLDGESPITVAQYIKSITMMDGGQMPPPAQMSHKLTEAQMRQIRLELATLLGEGPPARPENTSYIPTLLTRY